MQQDVRAVRDEHDGERHHEGYGMPLRLRLWRWVRSPAGEVTLVVLALAITTWITVAVWHTGDADVPEYLRYARAFWLGQPRFTSFPAEYPPLALIPFGLTLLPGFSDPRVPFALGMVALFLGGYALIWRCVGRASAWRYALYLIPALQATLLDRFDLVPALAVLAALLAARGRHFFLAYALLAVGILLKLYPLVLLPALMIEHARVAATSPPARDSLSRGQAMWLRLRPPLAGAALCLTLVGTGMALPLLRGPSGALAFLSYEQNRPVQVESLAASILWVASFLGVPATHTYSFGSDTYLSPLADPVSRALTLALPLGLFAVYAMQLIGRLTIERAFLVAIGFVLLASKVFSTQFMTWVLPLAAVAGGDTLVWAAICALTFADYPGLYPFNHPPYQPWEEVSFMAVVALRNALLLLLVAPRTLLSRPAHPSAEGAASTQTAQTTEPALELASFGPARRE